MSETSSKNVRAADGRVLVLRFLAFQGPSPGDSPRAIQERRRRRCCYVSVFGQVPGDPDAIRPEELQTAAVSESLAFFLETAGPEAADQTGTPLERVGKRLFREAGSGNLWHTIDPHTP